MTDQVLIDGTLPWVQGLTEPQLARLRAAACERRYEAGSTIFRHGQQIGHWAGVGEGLLKLSRATAGGKTITFPGLSTGCWFGEDALLHGAPLQYDVVALRATRLVLIARPTFIWLLNESVPFNRFVMQEMSARMTRFVDRIEIDQLRDPETSIARCLAALCEVPDAEAGGRELHISQAELGRLAGASRQRTNVAVQRLKREQLLTTDKGRIKLLDPNRLRAYGAT